MTSAAEYKINSRDAVQQLAAEQKAAALEEAARRAGGDWPVSGVPPLAGVHLTSRHSQALGVEGNDPNAIPIPPNLLPPSVANAPEDHTTSAPDLPDEETGPLDSPSTTKRDGDAAPATETASPSAPETRDTVGGKVDLAREATEAEICLDVDDYAEVLSDLFEQAKGEFCLALYGPWGRGKSFLARRLEKRARDRKNGMRLIRFSAWQFPSAPEVWVHLYETFASAAFGGPWYRRIPNVVRTAIAKNGAFGLIASYATIAVGTIPVVSLLQGAWSVLSVVYATVGVAGVIFLWTLLHGIQKTSGRLAKDYLSASRHADQLGLQATIGSDLRILLRGWIGPGPIGTGFLMSFWAATLVLAFGAWDRMSNAPDLEQLVRTWTGMSIHFGGGPIAALVVVGLLLGLAAGLLTWIRRGGDPPARVVLVVDDLDRCKPEHLLSVMESIKLLIEDPDVRQRVAVMMLVEEEVLKHAIFDKYGRLTDDQARESLRTSYDADRLVRENCEKLFTAHLRLPTLGRDEIRDLVAAFSGFRAKAAHELSLIAAEQGEFERLKNARPSSTTILQAARPQQSRLVRGEHIIFQERVEEKRRATTDEEKAREAQYFAEAVRRREPVIATKRERATRLSTYVVPPRRKAGTPKLSPQVLEEREIDAIREVLGGDGSLLREHIGPRTIRAFLFRYQLARLILVRLGIDWTPEDLAAKLAARAMQAASSKSSPHPRVDDAQEMSVQRVVEQVS